MVRTNEEFYVLRILNTPVGLSYEGTPTSMLGTSASLMPLLTDVAEIPGESDMGWYDMQTGEIEPIGQVEGTALRAVEPTGEIPPPDETWLRNTLATYLTQAELDRLAARMGAASGGDKQSLVNALVRDCAPLDLLEAALRICVEGN